MERKMMKIRVEIAEKPYRLTIPADEEERVRRAAKQIRDQIEQLKRNYDASLTEYLAMAAMRISIENEENKERLKVSPEVLQLKDLASELNAWVSAQDREGATAVGDVTPIVMPKARRGRPRKQTAAVDPTDNKRDGE